MKAAFVFAACIVAGIAACESAPTKEPAQSAVAPPTATASQVTNIAQTLTHGTYSGTLPCADCSGIDVGLTFRPDGTLIASTLYQGIDKKPVTEQGRWRLVGNDMVHALLLQSPAEGHYRLSSPTTLTMLGLNLKAIPRTDSSVNWFVLTRK